MVTDDFFFLLPEIRECIFDYCEISDLKSLACCCRKLHNEVTYLLYCNLKIDWCDLDNPTPSTKLHNIRFTSSLSFERYKNEGSHSIEWDDISSEFVRVLKQSMNLKCLRLSFTLLELTSLTFNDVSTGLHVNSFHMAIQICIKLENIEIHHSNLIACQSLDCVLSLPRLNKFSLVDCYVTDDALESLSKSQQIKTLSLKSCIKRNIKCLRMITYSPEFLFKMTQLCSLDLSSSFIINESDLPDVLASPLKLSHLSLNSCYKVSDNCLAELHLQSHLTRLDLSATYITDITLNNLSVLKLLKELILSSCVRITNKGISYLSSLLSLNVLYLDRCLLITEECLETIERSPIKILNLSRCSKLAKGSFRGLLGMPQLNYLDLSFIDINDSIFCVLGGLKLKELDLSKTLVSGNGIMCYCEKACMKKKQVSDKCVLVNAYRC